MIRPHEAVRPLILDREEGHRLTLEKYLRFFGFQSMALSSVAEALAHDEREGFDLILLDARTGLIEAKDNLTRLKNELDPSPMVLLMDHGFAQDDLEELCRMGLDDHLLASSSPEVLQAKLLLWAKQIAHARWLALAVRSSQEQIDLPFLQSRLEDEPKFREKIEQLFLDPARELIEELCHNKAEDHTHTNRLAHKLKGMSANIGAKVLSEICFQIEFFSRHQRTNKALEYVAQLKGAFEQTQEELKRHI